MAVKKEMGVVDPVDPVGPSDIALAPVGEGVGVKVALDDEAPEAVSALEARLGQVWETPMEPCDYRAAGFIEEAKARTMHCVNGRHAVSSQHLCSGVDCMAWREAAGSLWGKSFGYCGLAGRP